MIINRCLVLLNIDYANTIFGGMKIYIWILLPNLYGGYVLFFTKPFLINAKMNSVFTNPFIGMNDIKVDNDEVSYSTYHTVEPLFSAPPPRFTGSFDLVAL